MIGGVFVYAKINFKNIFIYCLIGFVSVVLSNIEVLGNGFTFIIPWILFCFIYNKYYGFMAFFCSFLGLDLVKTIIMLVFLGSFVIFKNGLKFISNLKRAISLYNFSIVFIGCLSYMLINGDFNIIECFLSSVISYWFMRCFYDYYFNRKEDVYPFEITVFFFVFSGVVLLGLNASVFFLDLSLIMLVFIAFLAGKVGKEEGVLFTFFISVFFVLIRKNIGFDLLVFISCFMVSSLQSIL